MKTFKQFSEEKLTPVYGIIIRHKTGETDNYPVERDMTPISDTNATPLGGYYQKPLTKDQALQILSKLEKQGTPAYAYHYGFKERGFRTGEKNVGLLAKNKLW